MDIVVALTRPRIRIRISFFDHTRDWSRDIHPPIFCSTVRDRGSAPMDLRLSHRAPLGCDWRRGVLMQCMTFCKWDPVQVDGKSMWHDTDKCYLSSFCKHFADPR